MIDNFFDTRSLINFKNKASKDWEKHNFIFDKFSSILFKKVNEINSYFKNILIFSSDSKELSEKFSKLKFQNLLLVSQYEKLLDKVLFENSRMHKILSSPKHIPLKNDNFDLIVCNFCLHNMNDKIKYLNKLHKLLNQDGVLFCNFFGEDSLLELKNSLYVTDEKIFNGPFLRIPPMLKMVDISNMLSNIGFKETVSESIRYEIYYKNVFSLLREIKGIGENNCMKMRKKSLMTRSYLEKLNEVYIQKHSNSQSQLKVTCDIVSICTWKEN